MVPLCHGFTPLGRSIRFFSRRNILALVSTYLRSRYEGHSNWRAWVDHSCLEAAVTHERRRCSFHGNSGHLASFGILFSPLKLNHFPNGLHPRHVSSEHTIRGFRPERSEGALFGLRITIAVVGTMSFLLRAHAQSASPRPPTRLINSPFRISKPVF